MKKTAVAIAVCMLASCSSLPEIKYPDGSSRVPINAKRTVATTLNTADTTPRIEPNRHEVSGISASAPSAAQNVEYEPESSPPKQVNSGPNHAAASVVEATSSNAATTAIPVAATAIAGAADTRELKVDSELASLKYAVFFNFASRALTPTGEAVVEALAQDARNSEKIEIVGRADNVGQPKYNVILAKARAESVRKALLSHGVNVKKIVVRSEVGEIDVSQDARLKGGVPTNLAERSRRADVAMAVRVVKGQKDYAENLKRPVEPAIIVAMK